MIVFYAKQTAVGRKQGAMTMLDFDRTGSRKGDQILYSEPIWTVLVNCDPLHVMIHLEMPRVKLGEVSVRPTHLLTPPDMNILRYRVSALDRLLVVPGGVSSSNFATG